MRVALYYPWIYLTSGGERVILELVRRSRHEWTLLTSHYDPQQTFPAFRDLHVRELTRVGVKRDLLTTARSALTILTQKLPEDEYEALFVLSEGLGDFITFRNRRRPSLCYCLTPLRAAFDDVYRKRAFGARGAAGRMALTHALRLFAAADRAAWRRYTRMLFLSRETVGRASRGRLLGRHPPEVLYPGLGLVAARPSDHYERFFLIAGRIMWTKHIEIGIRAFQHFQADHPEHRDMRLVVAGIVDAKSRPYLAALQELAGGDPRIEFRLAPTDADLCRLYETCYAVLFTPPNEDFGIVPLEGMTFGKPAIAVNRGGPTETMRHGVDGYLVEPTPEAFAACMAELAADPERTRAMGLAGARHVSRFTWNRFVDRVDAVLDEIADRVPRPAAVPAHARLA